MAFEGGEEPAWVSDALSPPSCWLSLEGGLLYAFVGPAAVIVLVCAPSVSREGCGPGLDSSLHSSSHLGLSLPGGHLVTLSPPPTPPFHGAPR